MTQKILIIDPSWDEAKITSVVTQHGCCAHFLALPMSLTGIAESQGWAIPCVFEENVDTGEITSWWAAQ